MATPHKLDTQKALAAYREGLPDTQIAGRCGVSRQSVRTWRTKELTMKIITILAAAALAACSTAPAPTAATDANPSGQKVLTALVPPKPTAFWIWPDMASARAWADQHRRSRICFYATPDGPATAGCRSIRVHVDSQAQAKELSGDKYLGRDFDCLEFNPSKMELSNCPKEFRHPMTVALSGA